MQSFRQTSFEQIYLIHFRELSRSAPVFTEYKHMTCNQLCLLLDVIFGVVLYFWFHLENHQTVNHVNSFEFFFFYFILFQYMNVHLCVRVYLFVYCFQASFFFFVVERIHIIPIICVRFIYVYEIIYVNFRVPFVRVFGVTDKSIEIVQKSIM